MNGSWLASERPGEAAGAIWTAGQALVLKESWKEVEAWDHVAGSESWRETRGGFCWRCSPAAVVNTNILEMPVLWGWPPRTAPALEWSWPEPRRQAVCAVVGGSATIRALWRPEDCDWVSDVKQGTFYTVELGFGFVLTVAVSWFSPLGVRKGFNLSFILQELTLETLKF